MTKQERFAKAIEDIKNKKRLIPYKKRHNLITKEILEAYYLDDHLTYEQIGDLFEVTRARISQLMKKFGIDTSYGERFNITCPQCLKPFSITRKKFHSTGFRYCSKDCYHADRRIQEYNPNRQGQRIAREVMSKHLNRPLFEGEVVHHMDGDCQNNNISNLMLFVSQAEHIRFHHMQRIHKNRGTAFVLPVSNSK